jgi:starch-binding outer membrane protein SusE/F
MKMKNKIILFVLGLALAMTSCEEDKEVIDLGTPPAPNVLQGELPLGTDVILSQDDADEVFADLTWTPADFGGKAVNYSIEIDKSGNNFAQARDVVTIKATSQTLTVEDINAALILFGIEPGETIDVDMRIRSWVDYISAPGTSNVLSFTLTPYLLTFPPLYINGDAQGWNWSNAVMLTSTTPNVYTGTAKFQTNGKFRFFKIPDWSIAGNELGWSNFATGTVPAEFETGNDGDNNILFNGVTADYIITVNTESNSITIELAGPPPPPPSLYLVTASTVNLDESLELESVSPSVYQGIMMLSQNTKFRIFSSQEWNAAKWNWNAFESTDELLSNSGDDVSSLLFTGTEGYYIVTVSLLDNSITLEATEAPSQQLYLIGDPNGWALNSNLAMRSLGNNVFEVIATFQTDQIFRFFKELDWNADQYRWSSFEGGSVDNELADGGGGDSNFKFAAASGVYKVIVSISDKSITVEPVVAPTLHIIGDDQSWTPANAVDMTWLGGGLFEATTTFTNNAIFRFFANNDPAAWDWSGEQWRYSSFDGGTIDTDLGDAGGNDSNFRFVGTTGTHTIRVNINALTIEIE